jgi:hypothetical protein
MAALTTHRAGARPGRGWRALGAAALAGSAALATALPFDFVHVGNFQRMTQGGDSAGQVELRALPQGTGH